MATATLDKDITDSILKMSIDGDKLRLPSEPLANYKQVKAALEAAGGKYNRGSFFTFPGLEINEVVSRLADGEKVNDKRDFQQFFTPPHLAQTAVERACIGEGMSVLEPETGGGALVKAIIDLGLDDVSITMVELDGKHIPTLTNEFQGDSDIVVNMDFLKFSADDNGTFDRVVMNPPFTKNQDVDHVLHALDFLNPDDGRLVAIMSRSWITGSQKKQAAFRERMEALDAEIEDIDAGEFKESGTNVAACMVTVQL